MPGKDASPSDWEEVRLDRGRIVELLEAHAPADWEQRFDKDPLLDSIIQGEPF